MNLKPAPDTYDKANEAATRDELRREDGKNLKRGRDIEVGAGRFILTAPDSGRWVVTVSNIGALVITAA